MSTAPEIDLLNTTATLAAATAADLCTLELAQYERVTIALSNTGANDVTALAWSEGAGTVTANNQTIANEVLNNLGSGEQAVVKLSGSDIPSKLVINATSTSGTTVAIVVKATLPGAAILPVR